MISNEFSTFDDETLLNLARAYDRALGEVDRESLRGDTGRAGAARHKLAREIFSLGRQRALAAGRDEATRSPPQG